MKTKAVSYLRVSGKGQVDGDGFPRQRAAIARFCKAAKYDLVEEFRDEGVSGTKDLDSRPGLAALLDRIESNGVTVLKLRAARERLRRKGHRVEGRKPYGFRPDEQAIVEHMRALRAKPRGERLSFEGIAAQLNAEGHTTRYGKPWTRAAVFQVLSR